MVWFLYHIYLHRSRFAPSKHLTAANTVSPYTAPAVIVVARPKLREEPLTTVPMRRHTTGSGARLKPWPPRSCLVTDLSPWGTFKQMCFEVTIDCCSLVKDRPRSALWDPVDHWLGFVQFVLHRAFDTNFLCLFSSFCITVPAAAAGSELTATFIPGIFLLRWI